jgi:ribose 5-phosphate isomerase A
LARQRLDAPPSISWGRVAGLDIQCVATSEATARLKEGARHPLGTLDEDSELDHGRQRRKSIPTQADQGRRRALLREKIVASASKRMAVIAD